MTTAQYLRAIKRLGLSPAGKATAAALGCSVRQIQRYAHGDPIPDTVAKLLNMLVIYGLSPMPNVANSSSDSGSRRGV